jgi:hypothetical protein
LNNPATMTLAPRGTTLWKGTSDNFGPRLGVTYQLHGRQGSETVLRGGFGIFHDLGTTQAAGAFTGFPFSALKILLNPANFALGLPYPLTPDQAAPPAFSLNPPVSSLVVFSPDFKLPYTYQWNIAVEQALGTNQTLSASYIAAVGRRLLRQERLSNPNPNFQTVLVITNNSTSDYHAMQLQYQRRLSRRLQALASYTWSHSMDNVSNDSSFGTPASGLDPQLDRSSSDFDVRHAFTAAMTYDLPPPFASGAGGAVFRNWSIDTVIRARSATPVNVTVLRNIGFGSNNFRPDLVPNVPLYLDDPTSGGGKRINPAAFVVPAQNQQGTLGRNALRGFPVYQVDFAIRRQFNLTEHVNLQLRAEAFNLFNHPNFGDPNGSLGSVFGSGLSPNSLFGKSTSMLGRSLGSGGLSGGFSPLYQIGGPRSMQLALKLAF